MGVEEEEEEEGEEEDLEAVLELEDYPEDGGIE